MTSNDDEMRRRAEQAVGQWEQSFLKPDPVTYIRERLARAARGPRSSLISGSHPAFDAQMADALKHQHLDLARLLAEARSELDQESPGEEDSRVAPAEDSPTVGQNDGSAAEICSFTITEFQEFGPDSPAKLKEQFKKDLRRARHRMLQRQQVSGAAQLEQLDQFLARLSLPERQELAAIVSACSEYGVKMTLGREAIVVVYPDGAQADWRVAIEGGSVVTEGTVRGFPAGSNLGSLESDQTLNFVLQEIFGLFVIVADDLTWHLSTA